MNRYYGINAFETDHYRDTLADLYFFQESITEGRFNFNDDLVIMPNQTMLPFLLCIIVQAVIL